MARCPLRQDMTGEMPECDKECAWLVEVFVGGIESQIITTCAVNTTSADEHCVVKVVNQIEVER